jgi:hypothetical protein
MKSLDSRTVRERCLLLGDCALENPSPFVQSLHGGIYLTPADRALYEMKQMKKARSPNQRYTEALSRAGSPLRAMRP